MSGLLLALLLYVGALVSAILLSLGASLAVYVAIALGRRPEPASGR